MVLLEDNVAVHCNGRGERAAWGELVSVGGLGPEQNATLYLAISEILEEKLNIPKSCIYLRFEDVKVWVVHLILCRWAIYLLLVCSLKPLPP